jgi:hypothetical protein
VDVLLHLVFIGLIGAVTIILFSIAAVSLLGIGKEPLTSSGIDENLLPYTDANAASVSPETSLTSLDSKKIPPTFRPQGTPTSETSGLSGAEPGYERSSPDRDESTSRSETADAALIPGLSTIAPRSTEVSGSEHPTSRLPDADVIPDASRSVPTVMVPAEERDQLPLNVEIRQRQSGNLDQASLASDNKTPPTPVMQSPRIHGHLLGPDAAFRHRVQKECGPIIFPALRRHCMASFGIHYR